MKSPDKTYLFVGLGSPRKSWSYYVSSVLHMCGIPIPMRTLTFTTNHLTTLALVEQKLFNIHKDTWYNNLNTQNKLRTYATYKSVYSVEPYVKVFVSRFEHSLIARLQSETLPLNIETMHFGLFHKIRTGSVNSVMLWKRWFTLCFTVNCLIKREGLHCFHIWANLLRKSILWVIEISLKC